MWLEAFEEIFGSALIALTINLLPLQLVQQPIWFDLGILLVCTLCYAHFHEYK